MKPPLILFERGTAKTLLRPVNGGTADYFVSALRTVPLARQFAVVDTPTLSNAIRVFADNTKKLGVSCGNTKL